MRQTLNGSLYEFREIGKDLSGIETVHGKLHDHQKDNTFKIYLNTEVDRKTFNRKHQE